MFSADRESASNVARSSCSRESSSAISAARFSSALVNSFSNASRSVETRVRADSKSVSRRRRSLCHLNRAFSNFVSKASSARRALSSAAETNRARSADERSNFFIHTTCLTAFLKALADSNLRRSSSRCVSAAFRRSSRLRRSWSHF